MKIKNKNGIQEAWFTEGEMEGFKKSFCEQVDEILSERYPITIPFFAIRILLLKCIKDMRIDNRARQNECAFSNRENVIAEANQQLVYILAGELNKHHLDWKSIFTEMLNRVKEDEVRDIPF